jgi:hypothetical protein
MPTGGCLQPAGIAAGIQSLLGVVLLCNMCWLLRGIVLVLCVDDTLKCQQACAQVDHKLGFISSLLHVHHA